MDGGRPALAVRRKKKKKTLRDDPRAVGTKGIRLTGKFSKGPLDNLYYI